MGLVFGLSILPVLGLAGAGIDIQAIRSERQQMQDALDAATLAVMSRDLPASTQAANAMLQRFYEANGGKGRASFTGQIGAKNGGAITGRTTARYTMKTMVVSVLGVQDADINVRAAAAKPSTTKLQSVAFRMKHITGAYDKRISLMGTPVGGSAPMELMRIYYNNPNAQDGGNTTISKLINGVMTPVARMDCTGGDVSSCTTNILSGDGTAQIDLENIGDLYLEMEISASNPTAASYLWPGMPRIIRTNDPAMSYRIFIAGVQQPFGQRLDLEDSVACGRWSSQDWEDGGNAGQTLLLSSTDVHYDVQGECITTVGTAGGVRLVE